MNVNTSSVQTVYSPYAPQNYTASAPTSNANSATTYAGDQADITHKQAGFFKRMGNGIGNFFNDMASTVGMGSMAHFAKESFDRTDTNRNNHLDTQEFTMVSQLTGISLAQADKNGDQKIVYSEYKSIASALIKGMFDQADTSKDGFLNYAETQSAGYLFSVGNSDSFALSDTNKDSLLSRSEFLALNDNYYKGNKFP